jgi:hypothetical protein
MGANNKHTALCLSFFKLEVYTFWTLLEHVSPQYPLNR